MMATQMGANKIELLHYYPGWTAGLVQELHKLWEENEDLTTTLCS